uniref:CP-type G domain-containing protein n=1 Tax=Psilocybe cubensis TaxID=181762 RepID=A0A8H7Y2E5_PSICU
MPKIRKETSNRKSTNDRAKLRKKIKESKRKKARDAKKSVQWKSKVKKDPGIPSEFPYKDQILAEVAEQRRLAAEEKEKRKADKQRAISKAKALARGEPWESEDEEGNANEDGEPLDDHNPKDLNVGAESIASLSAKFLTTELKPRPRPAKEIEEEEEEEEVPVLINRDLPNLRTVLEKADVVLEVVDGRDPLAFRSKHVEQLILEMDKKVLLVLNKIDTCPREAIASWSQQLRTQQPTLLFRAASSFLPEASAVVSQSLKKGKGKAKVPADDAIGLEPILTCFAEWAKEKKTGEPLVVAVVGITNVGKSSLINSLLKRSALPVYTLETSSRGPTTTTLPQEVTLEVEDQKIIIIDTPGLSFSSPSDADEAVLEQNRARDILLRNKGRIDRLKDVNPPIVHLVSRANTEDLMLMYSLPAFTKGDPTAFLSGVARANQLLKKKGELDLTGAARVVLRDWSVGKLVHYTTPPSTTTESPSSSNTTNAAFLSGLYSKDESILSLLPTRKEKRKTGGLVKLSPSVVEDRAVDVEEAWAALEDSEDEEDDEDEQGGVDVEGMDVDQEDAEEEDEEEIDEDEDDEEDEEDEEEIAPPPPKNQTRKRALEVAPTPERPTKKVAFAPSSKHQSRAEKRSEKKESKSSAVTERVSKSEHKSASASSVKPALKSSSKPTASTKAVSASVKKAANVASTKKAKVPVTKSDSGPEAYDFGKFF